MSAEHVGDLVRRKLQESVKAYETHPYRFLRESDLVCHIVSALQSDLDTPWSPAAPPQDGDLSAISADAGRSRRKFEKIPEKRVRVSRVRTEVKLRGQGSPEQAPTSRGPKDRSKQSKRVDICVLKDSDAINLYHHGAGVRDVVLRVDPHQVAALIEVKLYPSTYVRKPSETKSGHGWIDDLWELNQYLQRYANDSGESLEGHVVFLDTSIPIPYGLMSEAGEDDECKMLYGLKRRPTVKRLVLVSGDEEMTWPLPGGSFRCEVKIGPDKVTAYFSETSAWSPNDEDGPGDRLFLHGLGLRDGRVQPQSWSVRFEQSAPDRQ